MKDNTLVIQNGTPEPTLHHSAFLNYLDNIRVEDREENEEVSSRDTEFQLSDMLKF